MTIREATPEDLNAIHALENVCFPENEAASLFSFSQRLAVFPHHFWLLEEEDQLIGFINGMVTHRDTISDDMFAEAALHDDQGSWQSIFGLAVSPQHRKKGYAERLIRHLISVAKQQRRKGVSLTCKEYLIAYYEKLGFCNDGLSQSVHGGEVWYDLKAEF